MRDSSVSPSANRGIQDNSNSEDSQNEPISRAILAPVTDLEYQGLIEDGRALYKEALKVLEGKLEIGIAENLFQQSIEILERAVSRSPGMREIEAMEECGNALFGFGEMKLRSVQDFGSLLWGSGRQALDIREWPEGGNEENLEIFIGELAQDCEDLLVQAGRMYRSVLSVQPGHGKALLNWGLALSFRAELLLEEEQPVRVQV